jgi:2-dehydropantoate 2-reductase
MIVVLVYGAGAIGSFVGYLLSEMADAQRADTREIKRKVTEGSAVRNVALLGRKGHIQMIKESGLRINTPEESRSIRFNHAFSSLKEPETSGFHPNLVVVCAKVPSFPDLSAEIMSLDALDEYGLRVPTSYC